MRILDFRADIIWSILNLSLLDLSPTMIILWAQTPKFKWSRFLLRGLQARLNNEPLMSWTGVDCEPINDRIQTRTTCFTRIAHAFCNLFVEWNLLVTGLTAWVTLEIVLILFTDSRNLDLNKIHDFLKKNKKIKYMTDLLPSSPLSPLELGLIKRDLDLTRNWFVCGLS